MVPTVPSSLNIHSHLKVPLLSNRKRLGTVKLSLYPDEAFLVREVLQQDIKTQQSPLPVPTTGAALLRCHIDKIMIKCLNFRYHLHKNGKRENEALTKEMINNVVVGI